MILPGRRGGGGLWWAGEVCRSRRTPCARAACCSLPSACPPRRAAARRSRRRATPPRADPKQTRPAPTCPRSCATSRCPGPAPVKTPLFTQDVLVYSQDPIPAASSTRSGRARRPGASSSSRWASFYVEEQPVRYAAVDPATFRRYTPAGTAQDTKSGTGSPTASSVATTGDPRRPRGQDDPRRWATTRPPRRCTSGRWPLLSPQFNAPYIDAVVNERWATKLHMPEGNALLVSTGETDPPQASRSSCSRLAGDRATVQILGPGNLDPSVAQTGGAHRRLGARARRLVHLHRQPRRHGQPRPALGPRRTSAPSRCRSWARCAATRRCSRSCAPP